MKVNFPVTGQSIAFPSDQTLVSVTDIKGRITFCNPAFATASGLSSSELFGQAHNLVRHSDIPQEAYRHMWATIQQRAPWGSFRKESPQEWRLLLGESECHTYAR
jgi:aerotaxis receptor